MNTTETLTSAQECAQYIYDQDVVLIDYSEHIEQGGDPSQHVFWHAAEVLGLICSEGFQEDIEAYLDKQNG